LHVLVAEEQIGVFLLQGLLKVAEQREPELEWALTVLDLLGGWTLRGVLLGISEILRVGDELVAERHQ
jgi:hypothetical protein